MDSYDEKRSNKVILPINYNVAINKGQIIQNSNYLKSQAKEWILKIT
jgi:hypothetical protein